MGKHKYRVSGKGCNWWIEEIKNKGICASGYLDPNLPRGVREIDLPHRRKGDTYKGSNLKLLEREGETEFTIEEIILILSDELEKAEKVADLIQDLAEKLEKASN